MQSFGVNNLSTCFQSGHGDEWPYSPHNQKGVLSLRLVWDSWSTLACSSYHTSTDLYPNPYLIIKIEISLKQEAGFLIKLLTGKLGDSSPAALAIGTDEVDELPVFLGCPWTFFQPNLVTARLSSHPRTQITINNQAIWDDADSTSGMYAFIYIYRQTLRWKQLRSTIWPANYYYII